MSQEIYISTDIETDGPIPASLFIAHLANDPLS